MSASTLSRDELEQVLTDIQCYPEIAIYLDSYLKQYVHAKDLKLVKLLLNAGADPNPSDSLDCYLHHLLHEYKATKTTSGELVLELIGALLAAGANPNRVWCNNLRAYDYAVVEGIELVAKLLRQYGAEPAIRDCV